MAASSSDFLVKVGSPGTATTLAAPGHTIGGTSFTVVSTTNWSTDTGIIFAIDTFTTQTVNGVATAVRTPGSYTEWEGVVSSSTSLTSAVLRYGTDQNYPAGANTRVYIPVSSSRENRLVDGLLAAGITQSGGMGAIAPTSVTASGAISGSSLSDAGTTLQTYRADVLFDHVASGCVWTADAAGSTRNASMTSGIVYIGGKRVVVANVTARVFAASSDTYIDVDNTGTITYSTAVNNAASPALAANSIRLGIIVTGATSIAASTSVNQGQETMVLPIASSVAYSVTDSLGNLICPRDPNRKILGQRQIIANITTASSASGQATGLSVPVIIPTGRKIKITFHAYELNNGTISKRSLVDIYDGAVPSGTLIETGQTWTATAGAGPSLTFSSPAITPTTASKTYNIGFRTDAVSGGTVNMVATSNTPAYVMVELV